MRIISPSLMLRGRVDTDPSGGGRGRGWRLMSLALGLRFFQGTYGTEWNSLMAVSLVVMLPLIIVFFFAQKHFIQGVVFTGYK